MSALTEVEVNDLFNVLGYDWTEISDQVNPSTGQRGERITIGSWINRRLAERVEAERARILALLDDPRTAQAFRDAWEEANQWPDGPGRRVQAGLAAVAKAVSP